MNISKIVLNIYILCVFQLDKKVSSCAITLNQCLRRLILMKKSSHSIPRYLTFANHIAFYALKCDASVLNDNCYKSSMARLFWFGRADVVFAQQCVHLRIAGKVNILNINKHVTARSKTKDRPTDRVVFSMHSYNKYVT